MPIIDGMNDDYIEYFPLEEYINKINNFTDTLRSFKVAVNLRTSSGVDINAACGQLAVKNN